MKRFLLASILTAAAFIGTAYTAHPDCTGNGAQLEQDYVNAVGIVNTLRTRYNADVVAEAEALDTLQGAEGMTDIREAMMDDAYWTMIAAMAQYIFHAKEPGNPADKCDSGHDCDGVIYDPDCNAGKNYWNAKQQTAADHAEAVEEYNEALAAEDAALAAWVDAVGERVGSETDWATGCAAADFYLGLYTSHLGATRCILCAPISVAHHISPLCGNH